MLSHGAFLDGIKKVASMTNSVPPSTISMWYDKFKDWRVEDWAFAIDACCTELKFFPSVHEIFERKPRRYSKGSNDNMGGWMLESERADERGSPDLEKEIDGLTDSELFHLFKLHGAPTGVEFNIRMFRKNPDGRLYRSFIREAIRERNRLNQE